MKQILFFYLAFFSSGILLSQDYPIAVDDYVEGRLGEHVEINILQNDYHPNGVPFSLVTSNDNFHDSVFTYYIDYEEYYNNPTNDTIKFSYFIIDENGNYNIDQSMAYVHLIIKDNDYYDYLELNKIRSKIQASGIQFWPGGIVPHDPLSDLPVYEFPKESGKTTVFNSSVWVGGLDAFDSLHIAAERYRQQGIDYWPGPVSKNGAELSIDTSTVVKWQNTWKLTKEDIIYHKQHFGDEGYQPMEDIATWPAQGDPDMMQAEYLAPFVDVDGDGNYNPMEGDYPLIRGEQCVYFIINDQRSHGETGSLPLGIELHGMAYEFHDTIVLPMDNTLFFSYKIFNRSENEYHDTYIGLFTDFDLGYSWDDFVGCDVARGAYYGYNGDSIDDNTDGNGYGDFIPAQGIVILGGPLMDENGMDDPTGQCDESINGVGFGDGVVDNERYGMKKFIWFNNSGVQGDPQTGLEYYSFLNGIWKDGTAMEYGGNGHVSSGAYGPSANFMFPGLTDPCFWGTNGEEPYGPIDWTEETAENTPGDRRGLSVMGPFTFEPGSMERVDIAYVSAFPAADKTAVETLMEFIDVVKDKYYEDPTYFGYQWLGVEQEEINQVENNLFVYPNPVVNQLSFIYEGKDQTAVYQINDLMGKTIFTGTTNKGELVSKDLSGLPAGIYIISVADSEKIYSTKVIKK